MDFCGCFEMECIKQTIGEIGSQISKFLTPKRVGRVTATKEINLPYALATRFIKFMGYLCSIQMQEPEKVKGTSMGYYWFLKEDIFWIFQSCGLAYLLMKCYDDHGKAMTWSAPRMNAVQKCNLVGKTLEDSIKDLTADPAFTDCCKVDIVTNVVFGIPFFKPKRQRDRRSGLRIHFHSISFIIDEEEIAQEGVYQSTFTKFTTKNEDDEKSHHPLHTFAQEEHTYEGNDPEDHGVYVNMWRSDYKFKCPSCKKAMQYIPIIGCSVESW
eukprot:305458_1